MNIIKRQAWLRYRKTCDSCHRVYYCELRNMYNRSLVLEKKAIFKFHSENAKGNTVECGRTMHAWRLVKGKVSDNFPPQLVNSLMIFSLVLPLHYLRTWIMKTVFCPHLPVRIYSLCVALYLWMILRGCWEKGSEPYVTGSDGVSGRMLRPSLYWILGPLYFSSMEDCFT